MIPPSFSLFTKHERSAGKAKHSSTYSGTLIKPDLFILHPVALTTNRWFSSIAFYSYFTLAVIIYCAQLDSTWYVLLHVKYELRMNQKAIR